MFEYWKAPVQKTWFWHLKAANGEIIASGEGYRHKRNMLAAIALVKKSGAAPVRPLKKYR